MSQPPFGQPPQTPGGPQQGYPPAPAGPMPPYPQAPGPPPPPNPNVLTAPVPTITGPVATAQPKSRSKERRTREGAITAGVWLIAIGLVFLVKDWAGWSWGQAWPLFILAAAAASFVTRVAGRHELDAGSWSLVWPVAWFVIGLVVLAATTGNLTVGLGELAQPVVAGGVHPGGHLVPGRGRVARTAAGGRVAGAAARLVAGREHQGELRGRRAGDRPRRAGQAPRRQLPGRRAIPDPRPRHRRARAGHGRGWPAGGATFRWTLGLTGEKPLDLRLDTGASRATIDLAELRVRQLELHTGAAETRLRLPRAAGSRSCARRRASRRCYIEIPPGVAARIRSSMALGRVDVDQARFQRVADGWQSPDIATAPNRVELEVRGGVGSVTVR